MAGRGGAFGHLASEVGAGVGTSRREPMTAFEVADVLRWKERTRASWQATADYCGRNVEDVKRACGAVVRSLTIQPEARPEPPPEPPVNGYLPALVINPPKLSPSSRRVLRVLKGRVGTVKAISGWIELSPEATHSILAKLLHRGLVKSGPGWPRVWGLPDADFPPVPEAPPVRTRAEIAAAFVEKVTAGLSADEARTLRQISECCGVSRPTVGRIVGELVAAGRAEFAGTVQCGRIWADLWMLKRETTA